MASIESNAVSANDEVPPPKTVNGDLKHAQQQQQELKEGDGEERADQSGTAPTATPPPPPQQPAKDALTLLRSLFTDAVLFDNVGGPIHAYILPRTDAHYSEYLCDRDLHVQFISGFTGSNAFVVVTQHDALLWTDGRYFVQATTELRAGWTLMKECVPDAINPVDWCAQNLESGCRIGFNPNLITIQAAKSMMDKLKNIGITPVPYAQNLVDLIWTDRPPDVPRKLIHLNERECGETPASKLRRVATMLRKAKCDSLVLSQLDEIAWLFNLRGSDIPFNPVFFAYAFVTVSEKAFLFVDLRKMSADVAAHLKQNNGVEMFEYADIFGFLKQYHQNRLKDVHPERHRIWLPDCLNFALGSLVDQKHVHIASSPVQPLKMVKNASELEGMRKSHIRDSAALVKFFHWLRNEVALGHLVDENRAARQCHYYREQLELFVSPSFETISAVDEHAAIPHYHMDEESGKKLIGPDSVYLLDSGGQYRDGTTDVTRTVCFAEKPDERFRRMFTLVFKCHVQCAMAKFPDGTYAMNLDGVTRAPLWAHGYDFEHGVGHGVGHFLNVHEFPPYIGYRVQYKHNSLRKGVVVTIEPGYYEQGAFGIRFENCYELVEAKGLEAARLGVVASASSSGSFITFAPLTFVPVQKSLLLRELLEQREIDWLNHYHNQCLEAVGRYLQEKGMQEEYNFLAEACTPL
uniref:Xaa-Pro aminopeptidase n=1 Tax=Globodera rostochiensis TaxID=31243 RepID=A0A914I4B9_GLORO